MLLGWHGVHLLVWFVSEIPGLWSQFKTCDFLGSFPFPFHLSHHPQPPQPTCTQDFHLTWEVAAVHQKLEPTWLPGWGSQHPDNPRADRIGCSRFSERRNIEKLLFSSLILEGRRIFDLYHRVLSRARLTNPVGHIYLFPFTGGRGFFLFIWIYFVIQTHLWLLSCLYLDFFHGTLAKIQRAEVIVGDYTQTYVTMLCFELLFWNFFQGNGWVHPQENPNKESERWPKTIVLIVCSQACHVWALLSGRDIPQIFSGITGSDTLISGEETPILLARNQQ